MTGSDEAVDPVTCAVIENRIDEVVREMQHVMFRTGYSTIVRDSKDGSAGFCLPDGRVVGQAFRLPLHCGVFPATIDALYESFDRREIEAGDVFLANDPYRSGANHSPDLVVAAPAFHAGDLQGFCCTIAHKPDVGGIAPGSMSADAREIYHEGLLLPPVKYRSGGRPNDDVARIVSNNSRTPEVTAGDLRGQVRATDVGVEEIEGLFEEHGPGVVRRAAGELIEGATAELAAAVRPWDGSATVSGAIDNDVTSEEPIEIRLTLSTGAGQGSLRFGFEGSDPQSAGPSNVQPHVAKGACLTAVVGGVGPDLPLNAGVADLCGFSFPQGSVVNPDHPAPCGNYAKGMCVISHLALRAISSFEPEMGVAETGNKASMTVDYGTGDRVVHFEIMGSGYGGNRSDDGASCMATSYESNVRFTPVEIVETEHPLRLRAFEPRPDSAGAGEHRGGVGFVREYEALAPADVSYSGSNHETRPRGVAGGQDAPTGRCVHLQADGEPVEELDTIRRLSLARGERLRIERPGGGGYGSPLARPPERVLADVRDGLVTVDAARERYGVAIVDGDGALELDREATARLRDGGEG